MLEPNPYSVFIFATQTPQTREKYMGRLKNFFDHIYLSGSTMEERCIIFVKNSRNDKDWALKNIMKFISFNKERVDKKEITGATLRNLLTGGNNGGSSQENSGDLQQDLYEETDPRFVCLSSYQSRLRRQKGKRA
jgi:hypothetical protein